MRIQALLSILVFTAADPAPLVELFGAGQVPPSALKEDLVINVEPQHPPNAPPNVNMLPMPNAAAQKQSIESPSAGTPIAQSTQMTPQNSVAVLPQPAQIPQPAPPVRIEPPMPQPAQEAQPVPPVSAKPPMPQPAQVAQPAPPVSAKPPMPQPAQVPQPAPPMSVKPPMPQPAQVAQPAPPVSAKPPMPQPAQEPEPAPPMSVKPPMPQSAQVPEPAPPRSVQPSMPQPAPPVRANPPMPQPAQVAQPAPPVSVKPPMPQSAQEPEPEASRSAPWKNVGPPVVTPIVPAGVGSSREAAVEVGGEDRFVDSKTMIFQSLEKEDLPGRMTCDAAPWISPWVVAVSKWNSKLRPYYGPLASSTGESGETTRGVSRARARLLSVVGHPLVSYWILSAPERLSDFLAGLADELEDKSITGALASLYEAVYGKSNWGFVGFLGSVWIFVVLVRRSLDIRHARSAWARQLTATEKLLQFQNHNLETLRGDIKLLMKYNEKSVKDLELWKEQQEIDNRIEPDDFLHDKRDLRIGRYAGRLVASLMDHQMEYLQAVLQAQFPGISLPPAPRLRQAVEGMPGPKLLDIPEGLLLVTQPTPLQIHQQYPPPTIFDPNAAQYTHGAQSPSKPTQPSDSEIVGETSPAVETLMECVDVGLSEVEDALRTLTLKIDLLSHWSAENALRLGVIDQVILTVMRQLAEVISDVRTTTKATQLKSVLDPVWEKMSGIFDDPRTAAGVTDYLITLQEERYDYIGRLRAIGEVFARLDDPSTHQILFHWTESLFKLRVEAPPAEVEEERETGDCLQGSR